MTANNVFDELTVGQTFLVDVSSSADGTLEFRVSLLGQLPEHACRRAAVHQHPVPKSFTVWMPVASFTAPTADDDRIEQTAVERLAKLRRVGHILPDIGAELPLDVVLHLPSGEVRRHRPEST